MELPISAVGDLSFWVDKTRYVDPNLNGSVNVWYELIPSAGAAGVSESVLISVQDAASQTWPAPELHDASGEPVSSWSPVKPGAMEANSATFVLRDARLQVGDTVAPVWLLPNETNLGLEMIPVTRNGEARADIPTAVLAESLSKTVQVSYLPILAGVPGPLSEALSLQVLALPASALSELIILEAANGGAGPEFDVSGATTATLRVGVWPLIAEGQPVWLSLSGTRDNGSPYSKVIWAAGGAKVNASWVMDGYWPTNLPIAELKQLQDGSALTITFKAGLDGTQVEANAVTFAAKVYTVKADVRPVITHVTDRNGEVANGGTIVGNEILVEGTAAPNQVIKIFDGTVYKAALSVTPSGYWSKAVIGLAVGAHVLKATAEYGSGLSSNEWRFTRR